MGTQPSMFSLISKVWSASFGILQKLVNYGAYSSGPNKVADLQKVVLKTDYTGGRIDGCNSGLECPGDQKFFQEKYGGDLAGTPIEEQAANAHYNGWKG